jgi:DNA-binding Lrp family transcriptional regulator
MAAYILIQTEVGKAAVVAAALGGLPGVLEAASVAGPCDVIARAQARDIDELAKLAASRVQGLDGVTRTISCPVIHL